MSTNKEFLEGLMQENAKLKLNFLLGEGLCEEIVQLQNNLNVKNEKNGISSIGTLIEIYCFLGYNNEAFQQYIEVSTSEGIDITESIIDSLSYYKYPNLETGILELNNGFKTLLKELLSGAEEARRYSISIEKYETNFSMLNENRSPVSTAKIDNLTGLFVEHLLFELRSANMK